MLAGRAEPGLGGGPELLDVAGVNYYCTGTTSGCASGPGCSGASGYARAGRCRPSTRARAPRTAGRRPRALRPPRPPGRDEHRGRAAGFLAAPRGRGGARGGAYRRAGWGRLPLPGDEPPGVGRRPLLPERAVRDGGPGWLARGARAARGRAAAPAAPVRPSSPAADNRKRTPTRDLERLLRGFNAAYDTRRPRVLDGKTPGQVVAERLKARCKLANPKPHGRAGPDDTAKALLIAEAAKDVSTPDCRPLARDGHRPVGPQAP